MGNMTTTFFVENDTRIDVLNDVKCSRWNTSIEFHQHDSTIRIFISDKERRDLARQMLAVDGDSK